MQKKNEIATFEIAGTTLGVQILGDIDQSTKSNQPVLIFLHEALGSIPQWKGFPEQLSKAVAMPAIVYERQGFGSSANRKNMPAKDYLEKEAWEVLPQVIDYFKLNQVILVGHSDGATIALLYAARFPEKVVRLITEAAHVLVEPETLEGIREVVANYEENIKPRLQKYHGSKTDEVFKSWHQTWLNPDFADWNIEQYLSDITADALIIQGAADKYGTIKQMDAITNQANGMTEAWWIPDCGHTPHLEHPTMVLEKMANFINEIKE